MRVVVPVAITDAILTSTNVAENEYTAWNSGTSYVVGNRIRYVDTDVHMLFECIADHSNKDPVAAPDAATYWTNVGAELGKTNRHKLFDYTRSSPTVAPSPVTYTLTPGRRIDSLCIAGLDATRLVVEVSVGGDVVYSRDIDLSTRVVLNWADWFFAPFTFRTKVGLIDLPLATNAVITVTFYNTSGTVSIGALGIGQSIYLGITIYGPTRGAINNSKIARDAAGFTQLTPVRTVPRITPSIRCPLSNIRNATDVQDTLDATPAFWLSLDDDANPYFEPYFLLGIYKRMEIVGDQLDSALISAEIEGV